LFYLLQNTASVKAHEFWLYPEKFTVQKHEKNPITIRIGQYFKGEAWPYLGDSFYSFNYTLNKKKIAIKSIDGDDPAAVLAFESNGLAVVTHHTKPIEIEFKEWEKFKTYLENEGLEYRIPDHLRFGFPKAKITEQYVRCAKLLIAVGNNANQKDQFTGMPLELIAEQNPFTLKEDEKLPVRLLHNGKPLEGARIIQISKRSGERTKGPTTGADGRAMVAISEKGPWLLNVVHLIPQKAPSQTHWFSLWASLTFEKL